MNSIENQKMWKEIKKASKKHAHIKIYKEEI
jgi:hypothetical protein